MTIPIYDFDPDAKDQASVESRARVKAGFDALAASLQRQIDAERQSAASRHLSAIRRSNAFWDRLRPQQDRAPDQAPTPEAPDAPPEAQRMAPSREVT